MYRVQEIERRRNRGFGRQLGKRGEERRQEEGGWSTREAGGKERQQRVSKDSREAREAKGGCAVVLKG